MVIATNHDLLQTTYMLPCKKRQVFRTMARVWIWGVEEIQTIDQDELRELAKRCTGPRPRRAYKDPLHVKQAFLVAKRSRTAARWTEARNPRTVARKQWEAERLLQKDEHDQPQQKHHNTEHNEPKG